MDRRSGLPASDSANNGYHGRGCQNALSSLVRAIPPAKLAHSHPQGLPHRSSADAEPLGELDLSNALPACEAPVRSCEGGGGDRVVATHPGRPTWSDPRSHVHHRLDSTTQRVPFAREPLSRWRRSAVSQRFRTSGAAGRSRSTAALAENSMLPALGGGEEGERRWCRASEEARTRGGHLAQGVLLRLCRLGSGADALQHE